MLRYRLQAVRKAKGLALRPCAVLLGISKSTLSDIENGRIVPSVKWLATAAAKLEEFNVEATTRS